MNGSAYVGVIDFCISFFFLGYLTIMKDVSAHSQTEAGETFMQVTSKNDKRCVEGHCKTSAKFSTQAMTQEIRAYHGYYRWGLFVT